MKYFVTGITGYIGSNLARQIVTDGHTVNAIIRNPSMVDFHDLPGVNFYHGDLFDLSVLRAAMEDCDVVFHLAAMIGPWARNRDDFHCINVEGSENVFTIAREKGVGRVVYTSSSSVISPSKGTDPSDENTQRTIPFCSSYESSKAEAEKKALEFCDKGLYVVIVNPARIYGPGPAGPSNSITRIITSYLNGTWHLIPGDGHTIANYVFIDDVVHGHILASQRGKQGERYILGGENITYNEFFQILNEVTGMNISMFHMPVGLMMTVARIMQWQAVLTGIRPAITPGFLKKSMVHTSLSSNKAIRELGYRITPFASGVKMTLEWLEQIKPVLKPLISQP